MKHNLLTTMSLLSIVLLTIHVTDDIVRGMEPGTLSDFSTVPILGIWLYATLMLPDRRSGSFIILLGSLLGVVVPIVHMEGAGVGTVAKSSGGFVFTWILLALGITAFFCVIVSAREFWGHLPRWGVGQNDQNTAI